MSWKGLNHYMNNVDKFFAGRKKLDKIGYYIEIITFPIIYLPMSIFILPLLLITYLFYGKEEFDKLYLNLKKELGFSAISNEIKEKYYEGDLK